MNGTVGDPAAWHALPLQVGAGNVATEIAHAQVYDVLRLKAVGLGKRKIAAILGISATAEAGCVA